MEGRSEPHRSAQDQVRGLIQPLTRGYSHFLEPPVVATAGLLLSLYVQRNLPCLIPMVIPQRRKAACDLINFWPCAGTKAAARPTDYDENDPEQQLFLAQITKYNLRSLE